MDNTKVLLRGRLNLGFSVNYFSFLMQILCIKKHSFYIPYFNFFYPKLNKSNMRNNIIDVSSFQNGLNDLFSTAEFYLSYRWPS